MKFKPTIQIKQIGDERVLVSNDTGNVNFTRVITLNQSAEFLISHSLSNKEFSPLIWKDMLVREYGISEEEALADAESLIEKLKEAAVIE